MWMCVFTHTSMFLGMHMFMPPVAYSSKFSKVYYLFLKHEIVLYRVLFQETWFSFLILLLNNFLILTILLNFLSKLISFIFIEKNSCPLFSISLLYHFRNDVVFLSVSIESVKYVYIPISWFGNYKRYSLPSNVSEEISQLCLPPWHLLSPVHSHLFLVALCLHCHCTLWMHSELPHCAGLRLCTTLELWPCLLSGYSIPGKSFLC